MMKMSFYNGTLNRKEAKEFIKNSSKPCVYTYGLGFRNPTTHRKPITKEKALEIIDNEGFLDITEETTVIHLNAFSENDMW